MRRAVFLILGVLECTVAIVLVALGCRLPSPDEVALGFQGADRVTSNAGHQVQVLRRQVRDLRRPELHDLAGHIQQQTRTITATLKNQQIDFETVRAMRDALGEVADGLDGLARTLDPASVAQLGDALGETADFLEMKVVRGAEQAAEQIETSTQALRTDALRLRDLLRQAPLDLKAAREVHDSLARFGEGLDAMSDLLARQRLDVMRDGFKGMEDSLTTGAEQVERLANVTFPTVTFNGLKPEVTQQPLWPEGKKIAEGMRKAAVGATTAAKEMNSLSGDLPKLRTSLHESRQAVSRTREALATALKQQNKVEPLLKDVPEHAARLAEELPRLGTGLAQTLRDTVRLKEVAGALRQAKKGIDAAAARWPQLRTTLQRSATLLRVARGQLSTVLDRREDYEAALGQSVTVAEAVAGTLPLLTEQVNSRLAEEEYALNELETSLAEVRGALPIYQKSTVQVLQAGRLLAWLGASLAGLHGCYLMFSSRLGRRYSV